MIIYNVDRRFFDMKADAETHRKALKLDKSHLLKLAINDRHELAALLDGLCSTEPAKPPAEHIPESADPNEWIREHLRIAAEIGVPQFLRKNLEAKLK